MLDREQMVQAKQRARQNIANKRMRAKSQASKDDEFIIAYESDDEKKQSQL